MQQRPMRHASAILNLVLCLCFANGCAGVMKEMERMATFAKCEFRLARLNDVRLAGIAIDNLTSPSQLSLIDATRLGIALTEPVLPMDFVVTLEVKNPNAQPASMLRCGWRLFFDDTEWIQGTIEDPVDVPANGGISAMPVRMRIDLKSVLSGQSLDALRRVAFALAGEQDNPVKVSVRLKPSVRVGGRRVDYPNEIEVRARFTAGGLTTLTP